LKLQGIFIPVAVPFDHAGDLYAVKIQHNVEKWNRTGVSGYVVSGGESIYLTAEEKIRMWEWVAESSAPEKLLIAETGMPAVRETVALTNHAESLGYKAALVRAPEGPLETQKIYFSAVADGAKIPILVNCVAEEDWSHPNLVTAPLGRSAATMAQDFAAGATAAMVEIANAIPYAAISIWEAHRTRETEAALDWQRRIAAAVGLVEKYGVAALKHAMDLNGYYGGPPRLPLTVLTPFGRGEVELAFDGIRG
jgi:4-hydroxy-2-oxoglutarate aldolase